ncbi:MAG: hypothetical protein FWH47_04095 [Methanomassiliicoccaceae archaeon]|nr:hypothetical protein [Methanomassiliicoccaceae archaeon]
MDEESDRGDQPTQGDDPEIARDSNEETPRYGSNNEAASTVRDIREDFSRQLEVTSSRQNAMVQSVGIMLAFASMLFIETIRSVYSNSGDAAGVASLASFLFCCVVGVMTIWQWRNWELYSGYDYDKMAESFNKGEFVGVQLLLLRGVIKSRKAASGNNFVLRERIKYMALCLFTGIAFMLVGMVIG